MAKTVIITIPNPCHENWADMAPAERGRFCAACQKTVRDFTFATDKEIAGAVAAKGSLCGRFTVLQLNRKLHTQRPVRWPYAAAAGVAAFLGLGTHEVAAQEPVKTEQVEKKDVANKPVKAESITVKGMVTDVSGNPVPAVLVTNLTSEQFVQTDFDGKFAIAALKGDVLRYEYPGLRTQELRPIANESQIVALDEALLTGEVVVVDNRPFFSRLFHRIGNWFR